MAKFFQVYYYYYYLFILFLFLTIQIDREKELEQYFLPRTTTLIQITYNVLTSGASVSQSVVCFLTGGNLDSARSKSEKRTKTPRFRPITLTYNVCTLSLTLVLVSLVQTRPDERFPALFTAYTVAPQILIGSLTYLRLSGLAKCNYFLCFTTSSQRAKHSN